VNLRLFSSRTKPIGQRLQYLPLNFAWDERLPNPIAHVVFGCILNDRCRGICCQEKLLGREPPMGPSSSLHHHSSDKHWLCLPFPIKNSQIRMGGVLPRWQCTCSACPHGHSWIGDMTQQRIQTDSRSKMKSLIRQAHCHLYVKATIRNSSHLVVLHRVPRAKPTRDLVVKTRSTKPHHSLQSFALPHQIICA